jgi:hypothetical protein
MATKEENVARIIEMGRKRAIAQGWIVPDATEEELESPKEEEEDNG